MDDLVDALGMSTGSLDERRHTIRRLDADLDEGRSAARAANEVGGPLR